MFANIILVCKRFKSTVSVFAIVAKLSTENFKRQKRRQNLSIEKGRRQVGCTIDSRYTERILNYV